MRSHECETSFILSNRGEKTKCISIMVKCRCILRMFNVVVCDICDINVTSILEKCIIKVKRILFECDTNAVRILERYVTLTCDKW